MASKKSSKRSSSFRNRRDTHITVIQKDFTPRDRYKDKFLTGHLDITLKIPMDFYLRIGSGEDVEIIDSSLVKAVLRGNNLNEIKSKLEIIDVSQQSRSHETIIIPGSTLKGAIRFRLEQSFIATSKVHACYVVRSFPPVPKKSWRHKKAYGYNQPRHTCRNNKHPCTVCNIFGMMGLRGKIFFTDAELTEGTIEIVELNIRRGRTSREEAVKPGSKFQFQIYFEDFSEDELGLLFFAMNLDNNQPILLGRHKYAIQKMNGEKIKFWEITSLI